MRSCKIFVLFLCVFTFSMANTFANNPIHMNSTGECAYSDNFSVSDGYDKYIGYKKLSGYPMQDKFQVYFKGEKNSYQVTYDDLRGIDLDEIIEWNYEGKMVQSTRRYLYNFFTDTAKLTSHNSLYNGKFSQNWLSETFGQVYSDWLEGMAFSQDANRLVAKYFEHNNSDKSFNRFSAADIKIK